MKNTLDHIDILLKDFNALLPMSEKDQRRLDEKFRLEFTYNSNHMEGNTLTYQDTKALLLKDIVPQGEIYTMRELREMEAHDASFALIKAWAADPERDMNATFLKELNKLILVKDYWKDAQTADGQPSRKQIKVGEYKSTPNSVQLSNGEIFHYADPIEVPALIQDLFDWYNAEKSSLHPVTLAAVFHHKFVLIHPFDDGNGRISRLMVNYILMRNGLPPIVIKSSEKQKYLNDLRLADIGNMEAFIDYIADQVVWSLDISMKAAQGKDINEIGDLDRKLELLKKEKNIPEVKGKYTIERVDSLINSDIKILFEKFNELLEKFGSFYNSCSFLILPGIIGPDPINNLDDFLFQYNNSIKDNFGNRILEFRKINLSIFLTNPILDIKKVNALNIMQIYFHDYRIEILINSKFYYATYEEGLSIDSIIEMCEYLGNILFDRMNNKTEE
ncbi:MAG: hypothetical protein RLZZ546_2509 [Bacteroidota bacterium]|jgi:Fic family protein